MTRFTSMTRTWGRALAAIAVLILLSSATARADEPTAGMQKLQSETGLQLTIPDGLKEDVKDDGEVQLTQGADLFIAIQAFDSLDEAMTNATAHLKGIDSHMVELKSKDLEEGGVKAKAAAGTLKIDGKDCDWLAFSFDGGKKVLRIVILGHDASKSKVAESVVRSLKKI